MVNHKKSVESKCIPQWRHQYIEYGELTDLLSKAVKKVHKLFDAHATIIASHNQEKDKEIGTHRRGRVENTKTGANSPTRAPIIVLDELTSHQKFEKQFVLELSKATRFYNNKILEIKFEIIHLLIVAIKIGLIDEFELASEVQGSFDPGSTIGILTREMKGINIVLSSEDNPLLSSERRGGGDETTSLLSNAESNEEPQQEHNAKIVFVATKTGTCKIGPHDIRRKLIEEWLTSTSPTMSPLLKELYNKPGSDCCSDLGYDQNAVAEPFFVSEWSKFNEKSPHVKAKLISGFKRDMLEFYRQLLLVLEYGEQNRITVQKIMKKHRKELGGHIHRSVAIKAALRVCPFCIDGDQQGAQLLLKHLISQTEALYISAFSSEFKGAAKDRKKAGMQELSGFRTDGQDTDWKDLFLSWRFGYTLGAASILIIVLFYISSFPTRKCKECEDVLVGLYRLTGMAAVFAWMWALVSTIVISVRIDYSMVLQYDPRILGKASASFFDGLCVFTMLWLLMLCTTMLYLKSAPHWTSFAPLPIYPIFLFVAGIGVVIFHEINAGGWFFKAVRNIVSAPCYIVTFRDIFLADQFTSLVIILRDFLFMGCFLTQGGVNNEIIREGGISCIAKTDAMKPLFASLPSMWRFLQCLRRYRDSCKGHNFTQWLMSGDKVHIYNALKYANTFPIVTLSTLSAYSTDATMTYYYDAGWWCFAVTDVFYKCYWDFIHDWGLGSLNNKFLRPRLKASSGDMEYLRPVEANHLYPIRNYYLAMCLNFCMRSTSPLLVSSSFLGTSTGSSSIAVLEVVRRGIWNCFRLENRHLTHCVQQRARLMGRLEHFDRRMSQYESTFQRHDMFVNDDNGLEELRTVEMTGKQRHHDTLQFLSDEWLNVMLEKAQNQQEAKIASPLSSATSPSLSAFPSSTSLTVPHVSDDDLVSSQNTNHERNPVVEPYDSSSDSDNHKDVPGSVETEANLEFML